MNKIPSFILRLMALAGFTLVLAACEANDIRENLSLKRDAPDEFTVLSRPPLYVPPDFTLRPPEPGAPPRAPTAEDTAHAIVTGQPAKVEDTPATLPESTAPTAVSTVITKDTPSSAADAFLKHAGADQANDDIRSQLGVDSNVPAPADAKSLLERFSGENKSEPVVDAKKEANRLRTNKDEGKPINEGDVPVQQEKPPTVLDRIF